jgi:predicted unusual protein kinase regulating ubiquinone biosynthesis (AarF/ABC1/UbiB family)
VPGHGHGHARTQSLGDRLAGVRRQARVWRLTARRVVHFGWTRLRGTAAGEARRAELDEQFTIRTAEDVAAELGQMKGAVMKLGQMIGFVADGLPPAAQEAFARLQQDVPPMAPSLAEQVVLEELGARPEALFLDWDPVPVAAASIGQVHRAVTADGRRVAVKVQYPGVDRAIRSDLDHAERLYGMFSAFTLSGIDIHALVDELRDRMADELDYRHEADAQEAFAERYEGHPFVRVPAVVRERSSRRVLTTEWVDGATFAEVLDSWTADEHQHVAEVLFRFAQGSLHEHRTFNGDPHPGNYRFHRDGTVTFLDFGLVKRFTDDEYRGLVPIIDHVLAGDATALVAAMEHAGFLHDGHGLDPDRVYRTVSAPYRAYLPDEFTFTPDYTREAMVSLLDVRGPNADVLAALDMPPSFVLLDRVVWGVSSMLGRLRARNRWRSILEEYLHTRPPATELGRREAEWRRRLEGR